MARLSRAGGGAAGDTGHIDFGGLAYLSYELFEKRFLSLKRRFETAKDEEAQADLAADALIEPITRRSGSMSHELPNAAGQILTSARLSVTESFACVV